MENVKTNMSLNIILTKDCECCGTKDIEIFNETIRLGVIIEELDINTNFSFGSPYKLLSCPPIPNQAYKLIVPLREIQKELNENKEKYKGFQCYETDKFIEFIEKYINACFKNGNARVSINKIGEI